MARRLLVWLFFWRRPRPAQTEQPREGGAAEAETPRGHEPAETSSEEVPACEFTPPAQQPTQEPGVMANQSIAAPIGSPAPADAARGPVRVPPIQKPELAGMPADQRAMYFTHGAYAVARAGRRRLTAPDLLPDRTTAPRPGVRRPNVQGSVTEE